MDFKIEIKDSVLNKITESAEYPLTVFYLDEPFERKINPQNNSQSRSMDLKEIHAIIDTVYGNQQSTSRVYQSMEPEEQQAIKDLVKKTYNDVIQSITNCIRSYDEVKAGRINGLTLADWEWPEGISSKEDMLNLRLQEPNKLLKNNSFISIKTHLRRAKIELLESPSVKFDQNNIEIENIKLRAGARVEFWTSYKWPNCYKWCTKWEWVTKWKYVAITKNNLRVKSNLDINLQTVNNILYAKPDFKELIIDHNVFNWINLASLANKYLSKSKVEVYNANIFIKTIPVIEKDFKVSKFELIPNNTALTASIDIAKLN